METLREVYLFDRLVDQSTDSHIPSNVTFELTYGCNFACVHCLNPTHQAGVRELKTAEVCRILDEVRGLGVFLINFTGGELLTRPDLWTILDHAGEIGLVFSLFSNASLLTEDILKRLCTYPLVHFMTSIYGAQEETYEQMTQRPGSFSKFCGGLELLRQFSKMRTVVRMPVTRLNQHEIKEAETLVHSYGFRFQYSLEIHPRQDQNPAPLEYRLSPEEKFEIMKQFSEGFSRETEEAACARQPENEKFIDCACGKSQFAITPFGEMNLCTGFPMPRYDLRMGSIQEGWEVLKKIVREARGNERYECPTCSLKPFCRQGRNDAWLETGDPSPCLPHFKELARLESESYSRSAR